MSEPGDLDDIRELWTRQLAGQALTSDEDRRLLSALDGDEALRAELLEDDRFDGALRTTSRAEAGGEEFTRRVADALAARKDGARFTADGARRPDERPRGGRLRAAALWGAPLALAAAVAVVLWPAGDRQSEAPVGASPSTAPVATATPVEHAAPATPPARVLAASGDVRGLARGEAIRPGAALQVGETLRLAPGAQATVAFDDGARADLGSDTTFVLLAAGGAFVARGRVVVSVAPAQRPFRAVTPHGEVVSRDGRLAVLVTARATRLDVLAGGARFAAGAAAPVEVRVGQYTLAVEGGTGVETGRAEAEGGVLFLARQPLAPEDRRIVARLEELGFAVRLGGSADVETDARRSELVFVSATASAYHLHSRLREVPVPVIVTESLLYDDLGMTGLREDGGCGSMWSTGDLVIKDAAHPLAAGLPAGPLRVAGPRTVVAWGVPGPTASWVATATSDPAKALIFGYDAGAVMPGLIAPARRVGFFLRGNAASTLSAQGWTLFDAAVGWAAGR